MRSRTMSRRMLAGTLGVLALVVVAEPADAQTLPPASAAQAAVDPGAWPFPDATQAATRTGFSALAIEWVGGAAGSAAGFGIGVLLADADACNNEDLQCILEDVAVALGGSAIGSALGAWGAGRLTSTRPSALGAALGSIAGAVAGLGTVHLLQEELDLAVGDGVQLVSYVITQGLVTALGSRLIAAIRD